MKSFFYFRSKNRAAAYGHDVTIRVFQVKKNRPIPCGDIHFNTGSSYGDETMVFRHLVKNGLIPKKTMQAHNGYFRHDMEETHGIRIENI